MEVEFGRQLQQRAVPDRLRLVISASGDGLHVVEHQHPWHKPQRVEARHQPPEQRLLTHLVGEHHPRPAAVLQPTRQEVARDGFLLREREVPNLTPVDLQVLARQTLEANRHVGDGLFVQLTQPLAAHRRPPHRTTAAIGMLGVLTRQLHHAYASQSLLQPLRDLLAERIDARLSPPPGRLPIDSLTQCARHRRSAAAQFGRDLTLALATLVQQVDRASFHTS
jgi:hypothetical protein